MLRPSAVVDPRPFAFVPILEAAFPVIRAEMLALAEQAFVASPDSLSVAQDGYDERGWQWCALVSGASAAANLRQCPATAVALAAVPGLVNAGFSRLLPGTHLYPHCGEMLGVLRCHLPLLVPEGPVGMRFGEVALAWREGECVVFDDKVEHEAFNHTDSPRVVLLITFAVPAG